MLRRSLPRRRLGFSAEVADLEARIAKEQAAMGYAIGWRQKAEIERRILDDRKELGYVKLGEINRERAFLRSGGAYMRTNIARDLELALGKRSTESSDQADRSE